jgi:F0F1-type ATP synthase assembly protein I
MAGWLVDLSVDWSVGRLIGLSVAWSVDRLFRRSVGWLDGYLAGWILHRRYHSTPCGIMPEQECLL